MDPISGDHDTPQTPFLLRLFYQNGAFHRPEEFTTPGSLPAHISIHASPSCTLDTLALELAEAAPSALPSPSIGTRLAFQLVCPDLRNTAGGAAAASSFHPPRFAVKDIGSIVIGSGGPGATDATESDKRDGGKTLGEVRFIVGDYVTCAILPPLSDGSVAPVSSLKSELTSSSSLGHAATGDRRGFSMSDRGYSRGGLGHASWSSSGRNGGDRLNRGGRRAHIPVGEWRRGEQLPSGPGWDNRQDRW